MSLGSVEAESREGQAVIISSPLERKCKERRDLVVVFANITFHIGGAYPSEQDISQSKTRQMSSPD